MYNYLEKTLDEINQQTEKRTQSIQSKLLKNYATCIQQENSDCKMYQRAFVKLKENLQNQKQELDRCLNNEQMAFRTCIDNFKTKSIQEIQKNLSLIEKEFKL